jgi:hypothetical protein
MGTKATKKVASGQGVSKSAEPATQDFALPHVDVEFVPFPGSSIRANFFMIEFDGGAFLLRVFENREDASPRPTLFATKRQNVEVARFTISPAALKALDASVQQAKNSYLVAMGHELPDSGKFVPALFRLAAEAHAKQQKAKQ